MLPVQNYRVCDLKSNASQRFSHLQWTVRFNYQANDFRILGVPLYYLCSMTSWVTLSPPLFQNYSAFRKGSFSNKCPNTWTFRTERGSSLTSPQLEVNTEDDEKRQLGNVTQNEECPRKMHLQLWKGKHHFLLIGCVASSQITSSLWASGFLSTR